MHHAPVIAHAVPVVHRAPVIAHATPVIAHAPAYGHPAPHSAYDKEEPAPYAYEYGVADDYSKAQFNAAETADVNGAVAGSYSVALPDGRTQHVKYTADHYNGYIADVSYEGVPVYPEAAPYHA
ncbi:MAG: chitin-binding domain-containing protein, partial [Gammaproteobacteria bacterium]|nr:chitin-binding domain-containing protein [Gammaproteobacteria bacterium]